MKIVSSVLFVHLLILALLLFYQPSQPKMPLKRPLKVKTYMVQATPPPTLEVQVPREPPSSEKENDELAGHRLNPLIKPVLPAPVPSPIPNPTLKPRVTPKANPWPGRPTPLPEQHPRKRVIVKSAPKKEEKPITKASAAAPKANPNPNQDKLIAMMQKSLTSLNTTAKTTAAAPSDSTSKAIGPLASEALSFEAKYEAELVSYLETILSFPEKGEVKLKLTLKREGTLQKVEIVKASSDRNKSYIESALSSLSFPTFGTHFKGEASHTFTLTLTSENLR